MCLQRMYLVALQLMYTHACRIRWIRIRYRISTGAVAAVTCIVTLIVSVTTTAVITFIIEKM